MASSKLRNLVLLYLLNAVKEMGVSLPLVFRRSAQMASNDIEYLSQEFLQGAIDAKDFKSIVNGVFEVMVQEGLVKNIKIVDWSDNTIEVEVEGCEYLALVKENKREGNSECPLCLVALAGAIASATIKDSVSFNDVETKTDLEAGLCRIKIRFVQT